MSKNLKYCTYGTYSEKLFCFSFFFSFFLPFFLLSSYFYIFVWGLIALVTQRGLKNLSIVWNWSYKNCIYSHMNNWNPAHVLCKLNISLWLCISICYKHKHMYAYCLTQSPSNTCAHTSHLLLNLWPQNTPYKSNLPYVIWVIRVHQPSYEFLVKFLRYSFKQVHFSTSN